MTISREVVIVDDDEDTLDALADLVRYLGSDASPFLCSRRAQEYIREALDRILLIVTDLEMPHLDGETLARNVRAIDSCMPILLVSGAATAQLDQARNSRLFTAVIRKDGPIDELVAAVSESVSRAAGRSGAVEDRG